MSATDDLYFHSLHQLPECGLRVGETINSTGGRVWADTGKASVAVKVGCVECKRAYPAKEIKR